MRLHLGLGDRVEEKGDSDDRKEAEVEVEAPPPRTYMSDELA
jgi:hypothetical protein